MGGVKKVFKSIGGLIGLGSSEKAQVQQVATEPTVTAVENTSADTGSDTKKAKRRKGFASTQVAGDTILGGSASGERSTLG